MSSMIVPPGFYSSRDWQYARAHALARDGWRCTHVDRNGMRCEETRRLQVHHIVPMAAGGEWYALENLASRCRAHHREPRRGIAMRLELSIQEWWAAQALAGSSAAVPAWITSLVQSATADEVERQSRVVEEREERWRREHPEEAAAFNEMIRVLAGAAVRP
jgi:hypothetical protein